MKLLLLIVLSLSSLAHAQDKIPKKHLRFLPLGEYHLWKEDLIDGIRVQRASPPGAYPPRVVSYSQGDKLKTLRFSLCLFSDLASFPANAPGLLLKEGAEGTGKVFLKSAMPASPLSLGVLFRSHKAMTWKEPQMLMLRDDAEAFPVGKMRFVNVSDRTVFIEMAGVAPFGVAPGATSLKPLSTAGRTEIKVSYVTANGEPKAIWQNKVRSGADERVQCFFYKAQGKNPRDAVKFHFGVETVPELPE